MTFLCSQVNFVIVSVTLCICNNCNTSLTFSKRLYTTTNHLGFSCIHLTNISYVEWQRNRSIQLNPFKTCSIHVNSKVVCILSSYTVHDLVHLLIQQIYTTFLLYKLIYCYTSIWSKYGVSQFLFCKIYYFSNKCFSFECSIHQRTLNN